MIVDLRSDTVTKPSAGMRAYMTEAEVGDDVFGEDSTITRLEQKMMEMFGVEAAIFCPTATMCNQIAIKLHTKPMQEVICDRNAHVYVYEVGGIAFHSACSVRYITGERGVLTAQQILDNINPDDVHKPVTSLVCIENTTNRGGGKIYPLQHIEEIKKVCDASGLKFHLDGSRLFNAIVASGNEASVYGKLFDSITICLSKGLGCPAGAVLLCKGSEEKEARRIRKAFGGGMRQAGILAAAGVYALEHNISRLATDHTHAKMLDTVLKNCAYAETILSAETNIVIFTLPAHIKNDDFITYLAEHDVKAFTVSENGIRLVTHMDVNTDMINYAADVLQKYKA